MRLEMLRLDIPLGTVKWLKQRRLKLRHFGFESSFCQFESNTSWFVLYIPPVHLAVNTCVGGYFCTDILCVVAAILPREVKMVFI